MSDSILIKSPTLSLSELLAAIKELQHHDLRLDAAIKYQADLPFLQQRCQAEIDALELRVSSEAELLATHESKGRHLETTKQSHEARLKKNQERLNALRTNEEFQAVQKEIDNLNKLVQQCQQECDTVQQRVAELKKSLSDLENSLAAKQQALTEQQSTLVSKGSDNERLIGQLRHQRPAIAEKLAGQQILVLYETLRKKTAQAVAIIEKPFCTGCKMTLPPQFFNNILAMKGVYQCPSCFRILCYERST